MKSRRILKTIVKWSLVFILTGAFSGVIYLSFKWCHYSNMFKVKRIYIKGNIITTDNEILQICRDLYEKNIFKIDEKSFQQKLEKLPYIHATCISKLFPSSLIIRIHERKPLSFVKLKELYVADEDFILLPLPKNKKNLSLPVVNYQLKRRPEVKYMKKVGNSDVLKALEIIKTAKYKLPDLYDHISEVVITQNGFSIITTDKGIPVYLGKDDLKRKLEILSRFQDTIGSNNVYTQFRYIDLRWKKQIIVGSSRRRG